jgi:hypothetical protein
VVVLDDDRIRPIVRVDRRRRIPTEIEGAEKTSVRVKLKKVATGTVVVRVRAEQDAAIGKNRGRGRTLVND